MVTANEPLPSSGKVLPTICVSKEAAHFGERNIDRHGDIDGAMVGLRHQIELLRERAIRLGLVRPDAGLRLHTDEQRHSIDADSGCAAMARVGRISSRRFGMPFAAAPSETARQSLIHSLRAAVSMNGSLRNRVSSASV